MKNGNDGQLSEKVEIVADDHVIACHEAGHLLAARFCERAIDKVSLDFIGEQRGCFYKEVAEDEWTDFDEMLTLLAGPRAQIAVRPDSIPQEKLDAFKTRIVQPQDDPRYVPRIYDYTGWQFDVTPVYRMLLRPEWPVHGLGGGVTVGVVHCEVEKRLKAFFADQNVIRTVCLIADRLVEQRRLEGADAEALVAESEILESAELKALMTWQ